MNLIKGTILTVLALNLISCGKLGDELNPTYRVQISNPDKAKLRCTYTVDGQTKTEERLEPEFGFDSNRANEWIYISCQKQGDGLEKITAQFVRNGEAQETDECAVGYCIVIASGVTK